jgi:Rrf2 family iron-sulfur cluster assembly transcriptional regulator
VNFWGAALESGIIRYGKTARQGVAALSYLAEKHAAGGGVATSAEVGEARGMPQALAAKLLSEASGAGLVIGTTGPGGGYRLAKEPVEIKLADIVWIYERKQDEYPCPFGPGWCGTGNPCPLHNSFVALEEQATKFLEETTLAVFEGK